MRFAQSSGVVLAARRIEREPEGLLQPRDIGPRTDARRDMIDLIARSVILFFFLLGDFFFDLIVLVLALAIPPLLKTHLLAVLIVLLLVFS